MAPEEPIEPGTDAAMVAEQRSPDQIQREIEQTRAELADTIDAIADRISPRRAAARGASAVKAQVSSVFGSNGDAAPAAVLDADPGVAGKTDGEARTRAIQGVAASGGGAAYAGTGSYTVNRTLRTDRVLLAAGVAAAALGALVLWRSRRR